MLGIVVRLGLIGSTAQGPWAAVFEEQWSIATNMGEEKHNPPRDAERRKKPWSAQISIQLVRVEVEEGRESHSERQKEVDDGTDDMPRLPGSHAGNDG